MNDRFSDSFWSPSASTDTIPNFTIGLSVLYDKLLQSVQENEAITRYLHMRIHTERRCADILSFDQQQQEGSISMNAGLKSAFDMVCQESQEAAHTHKVRAGVLAQDVLEPLVVFTRQFELDIKNKKAKLEQEILEFEHMAQSALLTRAVYWSRCRALELACPDYRPPVPHGFQEDLDEEGDENNAEFVGGGDRNRSSSVTGELNVDRGGVRLGKYTVLPYREVARSMNRMQKMIQGTKPTAVSPRKYLGQHVFDWIRDFVASPSPYDENLDLETEAICQHLMTLKFLKLTAHSNKDTTTGFYLDKSYEVQQNVVERYLRKTRIRHNVEDGGDGLEEKKLPQLQKENAQEVQDMTLEVPSSSSSPPSSKPVAVINGFLGRFKHNKKEQVVDSNTKARIEMDDADQVYKEKIKSVEKMRKKLEEDMFAHFEDMERLEKERINTIKHAFTTMATALTETLSMLKETYNRITLFQETLNPEQDINSIVEQYNTGPFCPKPVIYENYYHGSATDQIFGVPLEEIAQIYGSYVPPIVSRGIKLIDAGLAVKNNSKDKDRACEEVWSNIVPIKEMNAICEKLDGLTGPKLKSTLEKYDLDVLGNLIRVYLLQLPECLLTFDLYEPVKILYATQQDEESRLLSVSKLLATLPSANYHTLKALSHHLYKLLKQTTTDDMLNQLINMFAYILMRPRTSSSINMHDRHPKRLVRDLFTHYGVIFTKDINKAQKSSASRSAIIVNNPSLLITVSSSPPPPPVPGKDESVLRRTLHNIMHTQTCTEIDTSARSSQENEEECATPTSSGGGGGGGGRGPLIVPHTKLSLFDDPDHTSPLGNSVDQAKDKEGVSTDVSLMLDMDDDDAIELDQKATVASPKNRSRASTRGTMDNVVLDAFFTDD